MIKVKLDKGNKILITIVICCLVIAVVIITILSLYVKQPAITVVKNGAGSIYTTEVDQEDFNCKVALLYTVSILDEMEGMEFTSDDFNRRFVGYIDDITYGVIVPADNGSIVIEVEVEDGEVLSHYIKDPREGDAPDDE